MYTGGAAYTLIIDHLGVELATYQTSISFCQNKAQIVIL
jgi:hypothetical protein